ncbi:hypothetical protein CANCADRAFT_71450 [Tortispora caseinolytica NRRL Y-17796]|uniref:Importin N-terminal domain-containing protein n=1 Tax=Tortispora caseinolytica NRRL Y-17796 TaxID=767744 RepID=A0A1E4TIG2_9ASCO|nr:hypothetical protein CANCADRAFT_71450 [Tortispora caseinolytica NRRL Y-17796]
MASQSDLVRLFELSLNPNNALAAEKSLRSFETQPGFATNLLQLVADTDVNMSVRLAASLFFKNFIRRSWTDDDGNYLFPEPDVIAVKSEIVPFMITLPSILRRQIGESISSIADSDFPERWPTLIDDLVARLDPNSPAVTNGVFDVAHSIFRRWRPLFRSNELFLEIKLVLDKFCVPFLSVFQYTDSQIDAAKSDPQTLPLLVENLLLIMEIYFDLNCQDIPEFFEDNIKTLMELVLKYFVYTNPILESDDENESGPLEQLKSSICDLLTLYAQRYSDVFEPLLEPFVQSTWNLLTSTGPQPKYDILISKAMHFLTIVSKIPSQASGIFSQESAINQIIELVILPNTMLRESDEELFEDDPIEFIRRDLEGADTDTRRRATSDLLTALREQHNEPVTKVVMQHINTFLQNYQNDNSNWKAKDSALYLFSACAVNSSNTVNGVSSINPLVDVYEFFTANVANDLVTDVSPIIRVDSIKYIYIFRNQLPKSILSQAIPVLSSFLASSNYVVFTYAAITIERLLSLKNPDNTATTLFSKSDIAPLSQDLLQHLFAIIERANTPEKLAENEYLMRCAMRVLVAAHSSISPYSLELLGHITKILEIVAKNPSNPRFTHFLFEALAAVVRFSNLSQSNLESALMPTLFSVLGEDIAELTPYVFQIIAQILEVSPNPQPSSHYRNLVDPLLAPTLWESRGNIPAISRLLADMVEKCPVLFHEPDTKLRLLGVFQKTIASKANDNYAFDLLTACVLSLELDTEQHLKQIAVIILQRLQNSRTEKFVILFSNFILFLAASDKPSLGFPYAYAFLEAVQPGLFTTLFTQFIIPACSRILQKAAKRTALIGLVEVTTRLPETTSINETQFAGAVEAILALLSSGIAQPSEELENVEVTENDLAFTSSYSRLVLATKPALIIRPDVVDVPSYVKQKLSSAGGRVSSLISTLSPELSAKLTAI